MIIWRVIGLILLPPYNYMPYKNKADAEKYYQEYYFRKFGHYPIPKIKKTKEEKLANKRKWYHDNIDKAKLQAKKSREKHKEQRKLDSKRWAENHKDYIKKYNQEYGPKWYQRNKKKHLEQGKLWVKNNPEKVKAIHDKFRITHPEDVRAGLIKYRKTLKGKYRVLKGSAVKRNYPVEISFVEFSKIVSNPCVYCGENEKRIGIDRIDNNKGYTKGNSAPCCQLCNMMKKALLVKDFLSHIRKISNYN